MEKRLSVAYGGVLKITEWGVYLSDTPANERRIEHVIKQEMGIGTGLYRVHITLEPIPRTGLHINGEKQEEEKNC